MSRRGEREKKKREKTKRAKKKKVLKNPDKKDGTGDKVKSWILQPVDFVMHRQRGNRGFRRKRGLRVKVRAEWFWKKKQIDISLTTQ